MPTPAKRWAIHHDERWSFILLYVGCSVVLSVYASLFWVAMLMLGHFGLEIWRHVIIKDEKPLLQALWNIKLDIALVIFSLVIVLYSDIVMAALGVGQMARAGHVVRGARVLTRFAIIERALRIFFLTVDDMMRIARIVWRIFKGKKGKADKDMEDARRKLKEEEERIHPEPAAGKLSKGDIFSLAFGGVCLALIVFSPVTTGMGIMGTFEAILIALKPF